MLISVILPVYNMEKYLSRCMDSILNQTYSNLEIILVDDGSKDSSGVMCDEYAKKDSRIKVIHQKNGGSSAARNTGLAIATGEYLSFVDADDWIEQNAYETLTNAINLQIIRPDVVRFNAIQNGQILNPIPFEGIYKDESLKKEFVPSFIGSENFGGLFIMGVPWLYLYKRTFIEDNNIKFILHNRLEDRLFNACVFLRTESVLFINDALYHYMVNEGSLTNRYNPDQWQKELNFIEKLYKECATSDLYSESLQNRFDNDVLLRAIMNIHYEFFSGIKNSFKLKYKNVKKIITNSYVIKASKKKLEGEISLKNNILLLLIKHKCVLLITIFEELILLKNKIGKKNG